MRQNRRKDTPEGQQENFAKKLFLRKVRTCPLSGKDAPEVTYKDPKLLVKFISESGKIIPSRVSFVSPPKQRQLKREIKRARNLALLPFVANQV